MRFSELQIRGAFIIEPEFMIDERGFFARSFCMEEFRKHGLDSAIVQCNISYNKKKGILRGMHFQKKPFEESKIVSCPKGCIYDVVLDLKQDSDTFGQWVAVELSDENYKMLYVPKGCAHGFQVIKDETMVFYQMTEAYHPECACGVRWDDPLFDIKWPISKNLTISEKDKEYFFWKKQDGKLR
jgi:dTDP-4-dehydrorhamnose 3,5-epimerase